jgi:CRP-like cAMP-binding protein
VPNSTIAKSKIVNVSSPFRIHGTSVAVQLDARTSPSAGMDILRHALLNSRRILAFPEPSVLVKAMNAAFVDYELTFFVEDLNLSSDARNELFELIHRHLASAGIELASPQGLQLAAPAGGAPPKPKSDAQRVLEQVLLFASLTPDELATLATKLKQRRYDRDDILLQPGTVLQSLFLVGSGVLSVTRNESGGDMEVLRFGPGDHFGGVGLLTEAASTATITALTPATVYELPKDDLAPLLKDRPQIAQELCDTLAQRLAAGRVAEAKVGKTQSRAHLSIWFSERLRKVFELDP